MDLMATVDKNWSIGLNGQPLVSIPEERKLFREETAGKIVVTGRKAFELLNGGRALPGRRQIVLSREREFAPAGVQVCRSLAECLEILRKLPSEDIFIAGGETVFEMFLPYCDRAHVTFVDYAYDADERMENLDKNRDWKRVLTSEEQTYFDICYEFRMYCRIAGRAGKD